MPDVTLERSEELQELAGRVMDSAHAEIGGLSPEERLEFWTHLQAMADEALHMAERSAEFDAKWRKKAGG